MAKRAVLGHRRAAAMVILGSVSSDIVYGTVALFGIAPFMETPWVLAAFNAVGALALWILAFQTFRESRKPPDLVLQRSSLKSKRWAYVTGFSLAFSNPQMMLSWLLGVALAKHLGLASPFPGSARALFVAGGALGLGCYLGLLGTVMYRVKRYIPMGALGRVYYWLGVALLALSVVFVYGAIKYWVAGT